MRLLRISYRRVFFFNGEIVMRDRSCNESGATITRDEAAAEASGCVRGEHDFDDDLDRVQHPVSVCLRCGLERTNTPPLSKTPENPREKCGVSTVRIDGNCNE